MVPDPQYSGDIDFSEMQSGIMAYCGQDRALPDLHTWLQEMNIACSGNVQVRPSDAKYQLLPDLQTGTFTAIKKVTP